MTCPRCDSAPCVCRCYWCGKPMRELSGGCGNVTHDGKMWCFVCERKPSERTNMQTAIDPMTLPRLMVCCLDEHAKKYDCHEPFVKGGYVYCTNGQILARMEYPCRDDTPGDWPPIDRYADQIDTTEATWREAIWLLNRAKRVGDTETLVVPVGDQVINPYYASLLMMHDAMIDDRPGIVGAIAWHALAWDGTEIRGVVMPCNPI